MRSLCDNGKLYWTARASGCVTPTHAAEARSTGYGETRAIAIEPFALQREKTRMSHQLRAREASPTDIEELINWERCWPPLAVVCDHLSFLCINYCLLQREKTFHRHRKLSFTRSDERQRQRNKSNSYPAIVMGKSSRVEIAFFINSTCTLFRDFILAETLQWAHTHTRWDS